MKRHAVDVDALAQHIARGAGNRRDDRGVVAREPIQQARLAGVRPAGDDDGHAFAQQPALARALLDAIEVIAHGLEPLFELPVREKIDLLLRKIDRRLDVRAQLDDALR